MASFSDAIIEEFRANGGQVTRPYPDSTLVLVTLRGAKSGREMTLPIEYLLDGGRLVVFGTKGGAPDNPAWFYNLQANPKATIETGTETIPVTARVADPAEREPIWTRQKQAEPGFAEYETKTDRQIPVVILEPAQG